LSKNVRLWSAVFEGTEVSQKRAEVLMNKLAE